MIKVFRIISVILLLLAAKISYGQQDSIKLWEKDQPLQWADFMGPVDESTNYYATTISGFRYFYTWHSDGTARTFNFKVYSYMSRLRSWSITEKQNSEMLKHEQLHFDISEYFARQLLIAFNNYKFTEGYKNEIKTIARSIEDKREAMETLYDERTNHYLNKSSQARWAEFVGDIISHDYSFEAVLARSFTIK